MLAGRVPVRWEAGGLVMETIRLDTWQQAAVVTMRLAFVSGATNCELGWSYADGRDRDRGWPSESEPVRWWVWITFDKRSPIGVVDDPAAMSTYDQRAMAVCAAALRELGFPVWEVGRGE